MIFAGQENPFIILRIKEIYIYFKTNNKIPHKFAEMMKKKWVFGTFHSWRHANSVFKGTSGLCVRFLKNVEGQGTQAIIKNLNLKKLKRFWNQNFIEVNDYTV